MELSEYCFAIKEKCIGDGCGLTSGCIVDMLINEFLEKYIPKFKECHVGEADCKINNIKFSFKKINGKSTIALDWSKNPENSKKRTYFTCDILILNIKSQKWWKKGLLKSIDNNLVFTEEIPSGFYFIDKKCKEWVKLSSNNKTNSLIKNQYLYKMLKLSLNSNLFIKLPEPKEIMKWTIIKGFIKK